MRKGFVPLMVALGALAQAPPREFTNSVGMKFVQIDPGSFRVGRDVTLSKGFCLQTTEVTQAQWQAVMGANPSHFEGPDRPVENVSWEGGGPEEAQCMGAVRYARKRLGVGAGLACQIPGGPASRSPGAVVGRFPPESGRGLLRPRKRGRLLEPQPGTP